MDYRETFRRAMEETLWHYESVEPGLTVLLVRGLMEYYKKRGQGAPIDPKRFVDQWIESHLLNRAHVPGSEAGLSGKLFSGL